jgi:SnoaL-like domain
MNITIQDRVDIEEVLIELLDARDRDEKDQVADLFTEDGVLENARGYKVEGRAALLAHFNRPGTHKHVQFATNRRFTPLPNGRVQVDSYGIRMGELDGTVRLNAVATRDVVVRQTAGWRVELHYTDSLMRGQLVPPEARPG